MPGHDRQQQQITSRPARSCTCRRPAAGRRGPARASARTRRGRRRSQIACSTARSGLQPPDHREPERRQERGGRVAGPGRRAGRPSRTANHAAEEARGDQRRRRARCSAAPARACRAPTSAYAPMPSDERQEQQPEAVRRAGGVAARSAALTDSRPLLAARRGRRSLRICSTIAIASSRLVRVDAVGQRRVQRQRRRRRRPGCRSRARRARGGTRRAPPGSPGRRRRARPPPPRTTARRCSTRPAKNDARREHHADRDRPLRSAPARRAIAAADYRARRSRLRS